MKFAVANQFFMIADQAGVDYTNVLRAIREDYPRAADLPGPGLRRRPVPVQGHDAARGVHRRPLPAGPGRDAGQRGPARVHRRRRWSAATAALPGKTVGILGHGVQGRVRRHPRVAQLQAAQAPAVGRRARARAPTRTSQDDRLVPLDCVLEESDILVLGAPHSAYRGAGRRRQGRRRRLGRHWARGSGSECSILVTGAAGFIGGYLVAELLEAGHEVVGLDNFSKYGRLDEVVRRPPALPLRRGRRQGRGAADASSPPTATRSSRRRR